MTDKRRSFNRFAMIGKMIEMELRQFIEYIDEASSGLQYKKKTIGLDYNEIEAEDPDNEFLDVLHDEFWKYDEVFTKYAFNSSLLSIYALLENWLKKLCDYEYERGFSTIKVSDLAGRNYIEKSKNYFEKVAGIDLSDLNMKWQKIKEIQNIRNLIAHNNANLIKDKEKPIDKQPIFQLINRIDHIQLNDKTGDFFIKDKTFIIDFLQVIKKYLIEIIWS